jgi:hypothetical protein
MTEKLYLHLYHGRTDPAEKLEDWGSAGPTFGPYESIQITYCSHIKMHAPDGFDDISWHEDLVFYDGVYYGDLSISSDPLSPATPYEEEKSKPPQKETRNDHHPDL